MLLSLYTYYTERELLSCDNLFPIRLLYNMQINMFKLKPLMYHEKLNYIKSSDAEPCLQFLLESPG